jgi:hypothetical protein
LRQIASRVEGVIELIIDIDEAELLAILLITQCEVGDAVVLGNQVAKRLTEL